MTQSDGWLSRYERTHSDLTNPFIYWAAVPMVVLGTVGLLERRWSVFLGDQGTNQFRAGANRSNLELAISCNWKLAVENYCEPYLDPLKEALGPILTRYPIA